MNVQKEHLHTVGTWGVAADMLHKQTCWALAFLEANAAQLCGSELERTRPPGSSPGVITSLRRGAHRARVSAHGLPVGLGRAARGAAGALEGGRRAGGASARPAARGAWPG